MKQRHVISPAIHISLLLGLSLLPGSPVSAVQPLAYYPFDQDLRDYSGNGHHGTLEEADEGPLKSVEGDSGITTAAGEFARGGGAMHFSLNRDTVSIPVGTLAADGDGWAIAFFARNAEIGSNLGGMVIGNNTNTADHIHVDSGSQFRVRQSSGTNATFGIDAEDALWHHYAVVVEDHDTDGGFDDVTLYKDGVYVGTVLNAAGSGFSATHIGDAYTNQFDFDFYGQIDEVWIFDTAITATKVAELQGSGPDATVPMLLGISDDRLGGPVEPGSVITYTVTFSEDMAESSVTATDFSLVGSAGGSIDSVSEISPRFFEVEVTPAAAGTVQLQINQSATLSDPAGNNLDTSSAILDDTIITVATDSTAPSLAPADMLDDQNGGPVDQGSTVIYTLTFSEDMDHTSVDATDFGNRGTATFTLGSITETAANVFEIEITPTSTGSLQLEVLNTAVIADAAGNLLHVSGGILDDTILTVAPGPLGVTRLRVFLLGGQSNALGSNQIEPSKLPTSPENLQLPREDIPFYPSGNNVIGAENPYERVIGLQPLTRFGPEITMARGLADGLANGVTTQVAIIKYARGATNLYENWKAGGDATPTGDGAAYQSFQISVEEGLAALAEKYPNAIIEIEGMLWVQGEWDANPSQAGNYETNLTHFIADIRLTYGADLPFVISRLSSGQTYLDAASLAAVQAAQDAVASADPLTSVFNTDSFPLFSDELHFDETGLQQIGNAASAQLLDFLNVPTPPQISSLDPAHLSSGQMPSDKLRITFDENIALGSGTITLRQSGGALVETYDVSTPGGNLSISGATLTINPTSDLQTFTGYYVEIAATAIEDLDGAAFAGITGDGTWRFTTGEPDTTKPQIQTLSPANGSSGIAADTHLTITFSEDVVLGSGSVVLRDSGGSAVESFDVANPPAGLTLNGASLTINPSSDLAPGTTYYVEISTTSLEDLAGNSFDGISGSGTWAFTTVPPDTTAPSAQTFSPTNGAGNIGAASNLSITFDEEITFGTGRVFIYQTGVVDPIHTFDVANPGSGLSIAGATLTINPTGDLTANTTYSVEIENAAIEDLAGNPFGGISGEGTWSFTTSNPVSTILLDFGTTTSNVQTGYTRVTTNGGSNDGTALVGGNISVSYPAGQTLHHRDRGTANFADTTNADLLRDIVYFDAMSTSDVFTFTISGLSPLQEYQVYGYAVDMFSTTTNDNKTVSWTTSAGTVQHTTDSANEDLAAARFQLANMTANASGEATITARYVAGGASIILWNGFEIIALAAPDTTPPTLSSTDPADQATGVAASANLVATFDEDIAAGSGVVTIKNLTDATESTIDITDATRITINAATLTINPDADLAGGKDYAIRIDASAIEDSSGNAFAGIDNDTTWNFSTLAPTFSSWIGSFSGVGGLSAFGDDPDGDGQSNGLENFFGTHPGEFTSGLAAGGVVVGPETTFTFTHPLNGTPARDLSAAYRWSKDLSTYHGDGETFEGTTVTFGEPGSPDAEGVVTVTATLTGTELGQVFVVIEVRNE